MLRIHILGRKAHQLNYGTDEQGRNWASWSGPLQSCAICGEYIHLGWGMPALADGTPERYVCGSHIERIEAPA